MKAQENILCPFWTRQDAIALKKHLQDCLTRSLSIEDPYIRQKLLTVAIAGAGSNGGRISSNSSRCFTPVVSQTRWQVSSNYVWFSIDRSSQILSSTSDRLRQAAKTALQKRPVKVELKLNASVTAVRPQQIEFEQNNKQHTLEAATIVWTTGTTINPVIRIFADFRRVSR